MCLMIWFTFLSPFAEYNEDTIPVEKKWTSHLDWVLLNKASGQGLDWMAQSAIYDDLEWSEYTYKHSTIMEIN